MQTEIRSRRPSNEAVIITGSTGDQTLLTGTANADTITGGAGDDTITAGLGADTIMISMTMAVILLMDLLWVQT